MELALPKFTNITHAVFVCTSVDHLPRAGTAWYHECWDGRLELLPAITASNDTGESVTPDPVVERHVMADAVRLSDDTDVLWFVRDMARRYNRTFDDEMTPVGPAALRYRHQLLRMTGIANVPCMATLQHFGLEWRDFYYIHGGAYENHTDLRRIAYQVISAQTKACLGRRPDAPRFRDQVAPAITRTYSPMVHHLIDGLPDLPWAECWHNDEVMVDVMNGDPLDVAHAAAALGI